MHQHESIETGHRVTDEMVNRQSQRSPDCRQGNDPYLRRSKEYAGESDSPIQGMLMGVFTELPWSGHISVLNPWSASYIVGTRRGGRYLATYRYPPTFRASYVRGHLSGYTSLVNVHPTEYGITEYWFARGGEQNSGLN